MFSHKLLTNKLEKQKSHYVWRTNEQVIVYGWGRGVNKKGRNPRTIQNLICTMASRWSEDHWDFALPTWQDLWISQQSAARPRHKVSMRGESQLLLVFINKLYFSRVLLQVLLHRSASEQESHLRSASWTCAERMEMSDPGFPACLGSLQTKLK